MNNIYRIIHLVDTSVKALYIFDGSSESTEGYPYEDGYKINITSSKERFSEQIGPHNYESLMDSPETQIFLIRNYIFSDDTIENVKRKIIEMLEKEIAYDEIYMFGLQRQQVTNYEIYEILTQNGNLEITQSILFEYLLNFININVDELDLSKKTYTFEDIMSLRLDKKEKIIKVPLGTRYFVEKEYPIVINPYDVISYDDFLLKSAESIVSTQNKKLLLEYGDLFENTIYLCSAQDVLKSHSRDSIPESITCQLYFPYLNEKGITSFESLQQEHLNLLKRNSTLINPIYKQNNEIMNMFENIYQTERNTITFLDKGIKVIDFNIIPEYKINLPLELILKLVKTSKNIPFVKFNPGKGREKIYRIYSNKIAKNGKKIPYLKKAVVMKLMNTIARQKSVSIYCNFQESYYVVLTFTEDGVLNIMLNTNGFIDVNDVETIIVNKINPIIEIIQNFLQQRGYNYPLFKSFSSDNIIMNRIHYMMYIDIQKKMQLEKFRCLRTIFNVLQGEISKGIIMRYKRVSYFNDMDSVEALITELVNMGQGDGEIVTQLQNNFGFSKEEAEMKYTDWLSNVRVEQQVYQNRKLKVKSNPGFPILINKEKFKNNVLISVDNINHFHYLSNIEKYIEVLLHLTQRKSELYDFKRQITRLCKKSIKDETPIEDDIQSDIEDELSNQKGFTITNFGLDSDDELGDDEGILGLLEEGDDYEDEPEDEDFDVERLTSGITMIGGKSPTDSSSSSDGELLEFEDSIEDDDVTASKPNPDTKISPSIDEESGDELVFEEMSETPEKSEEEPIDKKSVRFGEPTFYEFEKTKPTTKVELSSRSESSLSSSSESSSSSATPSKSPEEKSGNKPILTMATREKQATPLPKVVETKTAPKTYVSSSSSSETSSASSLSTPEEIVKTVKKVSKKTATSKKISPKKSIESVEDEEGNLEQDIVGMSLNNPNPFFEKMYKRDSKLFLRKKTGKFNAYSRICPSNVKRQPVILTDAEKEKIDKTSPGSYSKAIKYGSSPDNQYWYICPRYWCLKTNTSMTKEQVESGKCGGSSKIIPKGSRKVPKDAFVLEFNATSEHKDSKGNYIQHYPGFVKEGNHPDGLCIPCCFKSWDTPAQKKRRDQCTSGLKMDKTTTATTKETKEYIKGVDKFPLDRDRWGYLPISIQKLLHIDNRKCFTEANASIIKPNTTCILRKGIEISDNQSFIAVISDIFVDRLRKEKRDPKIPTPTIKEMKEYIIQAITLDTFITYFGGSLVEMFNTDSLGANIEKYRSTEIYKKLDLSKRSDKSYLKRIISAYEYYIEFLKDDTAVIDHTYLWDVVSKPNPRLFPNGVNLAILEIPDNDVTDNVEIICPTNQYSNEIFSLSKPTIVMMKKDNFYEPIYMYKDETESNKLVIHKSFGKQNMKLLNNIDQLLQVIKTSYSRCKPKNSMPRVYTFQPTITYLKAKSIMEKYNLSITKQIVNYNNKVIGLEIDNGYLPIEPSSIIGTKHQIDTSPELVFADDYSWRTMRETIGHLKSLQDKTSGEISMDASMKVMEDGLVVGLLTTTNQFIPFIEPEENIGFEDIEILNGSNYLQMDSDIMSSDGIDEERTKMIKRIRLESNFYNAFRNTLRLALNRYENIKIRKQFEKILNTRSYTYVEQIKILEKMLREFMDEHVEFSEFTIDMVMNMGTITSCMDDKCGEKQFCLTTTKDTCKLVLPKVHLVSGKSNEEQYYYRMADELIRHGKIRQFIFKPKVFLSFDHVDYNLSKNEMILLDTILREGYYDNLEEATQNTYVKHNSSTMTQPQTTQTYQTKFSYMDFLKQMKAKKEECVHVMAKSVRGTWQKYFGAEYSERVYNATPACSFQPILDIIHDYGMKEYDLPKLKELLIGEYNETIRKHGETKVIMKIWKDQGKDKFADSIKEKKMDVETAIISDEYYATNLDILLIGRKLELPILLISGTVMTELNGWNLTKEGAIREADLTDQNKKHKKMWVVQRDRIYQHYYVIKQPGMKKNIIPEYSVFTQNGLRLKVTNFSEKLLSALNIYKERPSFDDYVSHYDRIHSTRYKQEEPKPKKTRRKIQFEQLSPTTVKDEGIDTKTRKSKRKVKGKSEKNKGKNVIKPKFTGKIVFDDDADE